MERELVEAISYAAMIPLVAGVIVLAAIVVGVIWMARNGYHE